MNRPTISFIVTAYDRPLSLAVVLASIRTQTVPHEILVCCNSPKKSAAGRLDWFSENARVSKFFGATFLPTGEWGASCGYFSTEMAVERGYAKGEWLAFPCDDTIYVQGYSDIMIRHARENKLEVVYCSMVNDPMEHPGVDGFGRYGIHPPRIRKLGMGKDQFMVKRSWFTGFPGKCFGGPNASDGLLLRALLARGARHGQAPGVLLVHQ